jgi:hypothetical protein
MSIVAGSFIENDVIPIPAVRDEIINCRSGFHPVRIVYSDNTIVREKRLSHT